MSVASLLAGVSPILAEGSVYELLRRDPRVSFDPEVAHAGLVYDDVSRGLLAAIHGEYLAIASRAGLPVIAFADTWRASAERIGRSRFAGADVNGDNARFLRGVVTACGSTALVGAYTGPRGDAYKPAEAPSRDEAMRIHAPQIAALEAAGVDLVIAATLPSLEEARGIAALLSKGSAPWMLSFVVRRDGRLLDGTPLADAVARIDDEVWRPPAGYSINCVHPSVFSDALRRADTAAARVVALQANASALPPEALDGAEAVEGDGPEPWADAMIAAMRGSSLRIAGGCCGTSPAHIGALADRLAGAARMGADGAEARRGG
jgi:homocysteine S-methyltransferase